MPHLTTWFPRRSVAGAIECCLSLPVAVPALGAVVSAGRVLTASVLDTVEAGRAAGAADAFTRTRRVVAPWSRGVLMIL